jgi:hypothetical protein
MLPIQVICPEWIEEFAADAIDLEYHCPRCGDVFPVAKLQTGRLAAYRVPARTLPGSTSSALGLVEGGRIITPAGSLIHRQGIVCGVAFVRSSLRRMVEYASVVAPRRLASTTLPVIRKPP